MPIDAEAVEHTLDRLGSELHYWTTGCDTAPMVALTHGATMDHTAFDPQVEPLVSAGYRVLTWDLRGHGTEQGEPLSRMLPRSLVMPPGIPDFFTRGRTVGPGPCKLAGRAWSGMGSIVAVEVSTDGGDTWRPADLDITDATIGTWQAWRFRWHAEPGEHVPCCRATDSAGHSQPLQAEWNRGGYTNNAAHRIPVTVR